MKILLKVLKLINKIFHQGQIGCKLSLKVKEALDPIFKIINLKNN